MKRQYRFHSVLSREEVLSRLQYRTRQPKGIWDQYDEEQLFCKLLADGRFYLWKTGGMWQVRPQVPFLGMVTSEEGGGCGITGQFSVMRSVKIAAGCFFGFVTAASLGGALSAGEIGTAALLVPIFLLWIGLGALLFGVVPRLFTKRQDGETIAFIESNLLS